MLSPFTSSTGILLMKCLQVPDMTPLLHSSFISDKYVLFIKLVNGLLFLGYELNGDDSFYLSLKWSVS